MKLGRITFGQGREQRENAGRAMSAMFNAGYNAVSDGQRMRAALKRILEIEHHDDEPDVSHHWQENMTDSFCPGCIAAEALHDGSQPDDGMTESIPHSKGRRE